LTIVNVPAPSAWPNLLFLHLLLLINAAEPRSGAHDVEEAPDERHRAGGRLFHAASWSSEQDQSDLVITAANESAVVVDNLEVAQVVYLLLKNNKIRNVVDTVGKKGVLVLGRFTPERKAVLGAIRGKLREFGFVPMMFDFEKLDQRDFTETIGILASMSIGLSSRTSVI
jgi:hypothetical protein